MLALLLSSGTDSGEVVEPPATGGHGFVITDTAPQLWWKRKPRTVTAEAAEKKVREIAGAIERVAARQPVTTTVKAARREVLRAIAPQLEQMPGFDWTALYQRILIELHVRRTQQAAEQQAAIDAQKMRDEDDILILLMAA